MTKTEIIEETAAFYNSNNRASLKTGGCEYETEDGRRCAVGRCLDPEKIDIKIYMVRLVVFISEIAGEMFHFPKFLI